MPWKTTAVLVALALVVGACGDDDAAVTTTTVPTTTAATTTSTAVGATTTMGDTHDDHEDDDHEHGKGAEWDAGPVPVPQLVVTQDDAGAYLVTLEAEGFTFATPTASEHVPGEGHVHVFVDGRDLGMFFFPTALLPELGPGSHEVRVTLARNDHLDYTANGEVIAGVTTIDVAGDVETADVSATIEFRDGTVVTDEGRIKASLGDEIELLITSDVADEVHVHGYDVFGELVPGQQVAVRFVADIPGIFEVELESSHRLLVELQVG